MQTVEHGGHGGRARDVYAIVALQDFHKPHIDDFGVQALKGEKENGEIRGIRRDNVLVVNAFRATLDFLFQRGAFLFEFDGVAGVVSVGERGPAVAGELGIDRKIDVFPIVQPGELDGEIDHLRAARTNLELRFVLFRGEDVAENRGKLNFSHNAAVLDVREDVFQVGHAGSDVFHLPEALINLRQTLVDQFKGLRDSVVERLLQFLVDRLIDSVQTGLIVRPEFVETCGVILTYLFERVKRIAPDSVKFFLQRKQTLVGSRLSVVERLLQFLVDRLIDFVQTGLIIRPEFVETVSVILTYFFQCAERIAPDIVKLVLQRVQTLVIGVLLSVLPLVDTLAEIDDRRHGVLSLPENLFHQAAVIFVHAVYQSAVIVLDALPQDGDLLFEFGNTRRVAAAGTRQQ